MKTAARIGLVLTLLACITALGVSVVPGVLNDILFWGVLAAVFVAPVVVIAGVVALIVLYTTGRLRGVRFPWKECTLVLVILIGTYGLLKFYVPRRIAFAASRSSFEKLLAGAPAADCEGVPLDKRLGVYRVDEFGADPRGGVYFRVHTGPDGIGPDRTSYGFVHMPNMAGTPFGAAGYQLFRLGKDWYWFHASDDWF